MKTDLVHDVQAHLKDVPPPVRRIQLAVAAEFHVPMRAMTTARRGSSVARPRQVAMYLSQRLTDYSLPQIGRRFHRDHTTVMHAVRAVEDRCAADPDFLERVTRLEVMLQKELAERDELAQAIDDVVGRLRERLLYEARVDPAGLLKRLSEL